MFTKRFVFLRQWVYGAVGGTLFGFVSGILTGRLSLALASPDRAFDDIVFALTGALVGCLIGVTLTVWLVGRTLQSGGGFGWTLLGSGVGGLLPLLLAEPLHLNQWPGGMLTLVVLLAALGATLAYRWSTRRV